MAVSVPRRYRSIWLVLGILQVVVAVICVGLQAAMFAYELDMANFSVGFWAGIIFLISGVLAIFSWKFNTSCYIVGLMVVSIIAALVALGAIAGVVIANLMDSLYGFDRDLHGNDRYNFVFTMKESLTYTMVGFFVMEAILAIVTSALCCKTVCCGPPEELQVSYNKSSADHADKNQE